MKTLIAAVLLGPLLACGPGEEDLDDTSEVADALTSKDVKPGEFVGAFPSPSLVPTGKVLQAFFPKQNIAFDGKRHTFNVTHTTFAKGEWSRPQEALPKLGRGAVEGGPVWAPAAAQLGPGEWMLYYTAQVDDPQHPESKKKCIWRAHATKPEGPFVDDFDGPLVCQDGSEWSLDPYVVKDARGNWHLAARIDTGGTINTIQIRQLGPHGKFFAPDSTWHELARNRLGSWDHHVMENAGIVRLAPPNGAPAHWFVFYSAREWQNDSYSIGYADCGENIDGLTAPGCVKKTTGAPWLATDADAKLHGPGTPTFYDGEDGKLMSIQAWRFAGGVEGANAAKNRASGPIMKTYSIGIDNQYRPHVKLLRTDF